MNTKPTRNSISELGIKGVVPIKQMFGDEPEDTALLLQLRDRASEYLLSFSWCVSILETYFGDGVGGVVAVFLFHLLSARPDIDEWLWVVVGDLPAAYFVTDDLKSPYQVLEAYIEHRARWTEYASEGKAAPDDIMPAGVTPTPEWANELRQRLDVLKEHILPFFRKE